MAKMNHTINITVRNKVATAAENVQIVCGNSDYIAIFAFDADWQGAEAKTARFYSTGNRYTDIVFSGNECPIPALYNTRLCKIGVFAGDLMTTTPAYIDCVPSILCADGTPADPTPDVYNQLIEMIDSGMLRGQKGDRGDPGLPGPQGPQGSSGLVRSVLNAMLQSNVAWTGTGPYIQTLALPNIQESDTPRITPVYDENRAIARNQMAAWQCISFAKAQDEQIVFTCLDQKPKIAIPIQIEIIVPGMARSVLNATLQGNTAWSGTGPYTQTVVLAQIKETDTPHITPVYDEDPETARSQMEAWQYVSFAKTQNGLVVFTCLDKQPETAIPIQIEVIS